MQSPDQHWLSSLSGLESGTSTELWLECLDSLGRQENAVLMMRYILPYLHPLASDSPLPSTDMGTILRCIDTLLVIALATKVSITLFWLPQPHSTTVLARCGCCTLGYLSFLSMSGISHESDSVPLWRMLSEWHHFPHQWPVGQVLSSQLPAYPDSNASRIKSCLTRDISRCAGTDQG